MLARMCASVVAATLLLIPFGCKAQPTSTMSAEEVTELDKMAKPLVRPWQQRTVTYVDGGHHWPLYLEDGPLERFGCSTGDLFQPFVSTALASLHTVALPYSLARTPPWEKQRPGEYMKELPDGCMLPHRFDFLAALVEGGTVFGLIALIP